MNAKTWHVLSILGLIFSCLHAGAQTPRPPVPPEELAQRVDREIHVGGTVKKPSISGSPRGANFWSSFVLGIAKLFS